MRALVELENVSFGYGEARVIEDVSLRLDSGQYAALVGPSGAGKTTLLKLVLGMLDATQGEVRVGGRPLRDRPPARVGYVPQLETVDWNFPMTVEEVVLLGRIRRSWRWPWASREDRRCVRQVLEQLGIDSLSRHHIRNLSGGQQQRVFLARALVAEPDLLVLDEPTTGVDARTVDSVLHLLASLNRKGITILMTTHDLNAVAAHVPWAICLNRRLIAQGTPEEVFTEEILSETYEGEMLVLRQDGMLFVHQKPHGHAYSDVMSEVLSNE